MNSLSSKAHPFFVAFLILFLFSAVESKENDLCPSISKTETAGYNSASTNELTKEATQEDIEGYNQPVKTRLHSIRIRARFSSLDVLGDVSPEDFFEFDLAASFRSPWMWYTRSGWGADIRLMNSIGVLYGAGDYAFVVSVIPLLAIGSQDGKYSIDMGAGGALLSNREFGHQDYGGYFQFALTFGISFPLFSRFGAGYRYLHYSDAAIYGPHNTGADLHMLELFYRF